MLQKVISFIVNEFAQKEIDSEEHKIESEKYQIHFNELTSILNEEHKKKLLDLDTAHFMCAGQCKDDGYKEGLETGIKFATQFIIDTLKNS